MRDLKMYLIVLAALGCQKLPFIEHVNRKLLAMTFEQRSMSPLQATSFVAAALNVDRLMPIANQQLMILGI